MIPRSPDPPVINFHHKIIDYSEAESRLKASNTKGYFLTCECRNRRGTFILSYIINCSTVKHIVILHNKSTKFLKIEDLLSEVFSVIDSIEECLIPLVPPEDDVEVEVNLHPGQEENKDKTNLVYKYIS